MDRVALAETLMSSVVLAIGFGFLGSVLFHLLSRMASIAVGALITLVALLWMVRRRLRRSRAEFSIRGFVLYDPFTAELLAVDGYEFSKEISDYQIALCHERSDLFFEWLADPLEAITADSGTGLPISRDKENWAAQLLREMVECATLERLVVHLTDYFRSQGLDESLLETYDREAIVEVLTGNRVIEHFSRLDRPSLAGMTLPGGTPLSEAPEGSLKMLVGGGTHYFAAELQLPAGSTIERDAEGAILVDHPLLSIRLNTVFDGSVFNLPAEFPQTYMGLSEADAHRVTSYQAGVDLSVTAKVRGVLSLRGWRYQLWTEAFIDSLEEGFGGDSFFASHEWPTVHALLRSLGRSGTPDPNRNWTYREVLGAGSDEGDVGRAVDRELVSAIGAALDGDRSAREYLDKRLPKLQASEDEEQLGQAITRVLQGASPESVIPGMGPRTREFLEALAAHLAQLRAFERRRLMSVLVASAAAARGDGRARAAVEDHFSAAEQQGPNQLTDRLRRIIDGERGDDLWQESDPELQPLIWSVLKQLRRQEA